MTGVEQLYFTSALDVLAKVVSGAGDDILRGGNGDDNLGGGLGDNLLYGFGGNDTLAVTVDTQADTLYGGAGDDFFFGANPGDRVDGGVGFDRLFLTFTHRVDNSAQVLTSLTTWTSIEDVNITLSAGGDVFRMSVGNTIHVASITLDGGGGLDRLVLDQSTGKTVNVSISDRTTLPLLPFVSMSPQLNPRNVEQLHFLGSSGNDIAVGAALNDTLIGGAGDDWLFVGRGANLAMGGAGNDIIGDVTWDDTVHGGDGIDILHANLRNAQHGVRFTATQNPGNFTGFEHVTGVLTDHDDYVQTTMLAGNLAGGAGNDTLVLDYSADTSRPYTYDLSYIEEAAWGYPTPWRMV